MGGGSQYTFYSVVVWSVGTMMMAVITYTAPHGAGGNQVVRPTD